jgi:squalene-hopene/tetraprenyl-beta-curcumene cyclase
MANSVMMFAVLGYPEDHPQRAIARKSVEKLLVVHERRGLLPALRFADLGHRPDLRTRCLEVGGDARSAQVKRGLDWLVPQQVLDVRGDWIARRPIFGPAAGRSNMPTRIIPTSTIPPSSPWRWIGAKSFRPQRISTAASRARANGSRHAERERRWGAFDADNEYYYLNNIPFADHGALLDPPTEDVTARCLSMLAQFGETVEKSPAVARASIICKRTQLAEGSWYGRWGMNYIYGTWSVLCALNAVGVERGAPEMRKAVDWLIAIQNDRWRLGRGRIEL